MRSMMIAFDLLRKEASTPAGLLMSVPKAIGAAGKAGAESLARSGIKNKAVLTAARYTPHALVAAGAHQTYTSPTGRRLRYKIQEMKMRRRMKRQGGY